MSPARAPRGRTKTSVLLFRLASFVIAAAMHSLLIAAFAATPERRPSVPSVRPRGNIEVRIDSADAYPDDGPSGPIG